MKTFEDHLRAQERRVLPPDWKDGILTNAVADDALLKQSIMACLLPSPLRYCLAAAWIAILSLNASSLAEDPSEMVSGSSRPDHPVTLLASIQLAERFLEDEEVLP